MGIPITRVIALILAAGATCLAERFHFRVFGEREGLVNPVIRRVAQDAQGMFWVLARSGLYRFDGERFTFVGAIPDRNLIWAQAAPDGSMWFRSHRAVYQWADGRFALVLQDDALATAAPQAIAAAVPGAVWVLTRSGQRLERLQRQGSSWRRETVHQSAAPLHSILARAGGALMAGCGAGLCERTKSGEWRVLPGVPADRYVSIVDARDGSVLARGARRIVRAWPGENRVEDLTGDLPPLTGESNLPTVAVDFHRRVIANGDAGLHRREGGRWRAVAEREGLHDMTSSILVDRDGAIWLGTFNGLHRWLGDGAWTTLGPQDGLPRKGVEVVVRDSGGNVWASSSTVGVYRGADSPVGWRFREIPGLPPSKALIPTAADSVWLGPGTGGMLRYDRGRRIAVEGVPASVRVNEFSMDDAHGVLAATTEGLYGQDGPNRMRLLWKSAEILTIGWSPNGDFWLGLQGSIARLRGFTVETFTSDDAIERAGVRAVYGDAQGHIWIGTWGTNGLRAYEVEGQRLRLSKLSQPQELKADSFFIHLDQAKAVWAGSNRGLTAYRKNRWYRYDRNNGLNSDHCTAACFMGDGSIWFATQGGLAHYEPPVDHPPDTPPAVVITAARSRFGSQLSESGLMQIPPAEADISVDFSVLSTVLDSPPPVRYRLHANEDWRTTSRRSLEFLQVGAGDYQLQVEAQGLNGTWTAAPARLAFRVLPPWWATWWFRLSGALAVAGLMALAWRTRIRAAADVHLDRLRAMVDRYPGVVFILDPAGRFVLANRRLEQYTRQSAGGLRGKFPSEVMTPENAANFERNHRKLLQKGDLMEYREEYKVSGGKVVFDIRAFPLHGTTGEIELVCVFATDVTDRVRLETENEQAAQRYEAFVRQITEAIWRIEYEPPIPLDLPEDQFADACYERGFVREANDVVAAFFGVPAEALIGKSYGELIDRHARETRIADRHWFKNNFRLRDFPTVRIDPSGEKRIFLANTIGIVENNCLVRTWSTQREVTQQRRLEKMVANTARGVSAETGARFFDSLVGHLARSLKADRAVAAELLPGGRRVRVLAAWLDGTLTSGREFDLTEGMPALTAVESARTSFWQASDGTNSAIPPDLAVWLGVACTAVPIKAANTVTGFLAVSWQRSAEPAKEAVPVLEIFAARAGAELARLRVERELVTSREQLRALASRTQQLAEKERAYLAREIHDELGQQLTAIKIGLSAAGNQLNKGQPERASQQLAELTALADETVRSVRRVSTELRPPVLDQLGLAAAIRWQVKELRQRLGIPVECHLEDVTTTREVSLVAFRILQESLTNVMRHAKAQHVEVRLEERSECVYLSIGDDGVGFVPNPGANGSLGLLGMHERAVAVGGRVTIESEPGKGTAVLAVLPLQGERNPEGE